MAQRQVLVEMRVPYDAPDRQVQELAHQLTHIGFDWDPDYIVPMETAPGGSKGRRRRRYRSVILRGRIEEGREPELEAHSNIVRVWSDAPIVPFTPTGEAEKKGDEEAKRFPLKNPFTF